MEETVQSFFYVLIILSCYFAPLIIARHRKHKNTSAIAVINTFLGWTMIGWVIPLAWAFTDNVKE